jgi:hypothetical protein
MKGIAAGLGHTAPEIMVTIHMIGIEQCHSSQNENKSRQVESPQSEVLELQPLPEYCHF